MSSPARQNALAGLYDEKTLALIKRTVAADTNNDEFSLFIHMARHMKLDPLRRQIFAFVFSKDDAKKRRMSVVTAIDGFRAIAERTGNYRPDEDAPIFEQDKTLANATNPLGIVSATVRIWKFSHDEWHRITGVAFWDEHAPLKEEWVDDRETGRRKPSGKKKLDETSQWVKMPKLMLSKCAEAMALRKGWPDDFANVYETSEVDRAKVMDMLPSEAAQQGDVMSRQEKLGTRDTIPMIFNDSGDLELIPVGQVADRCMEYLKLNTDEPAALRLWEQKNRVGLNEFWTRAPRDALELKKHIEDATRGSF